MRAHVQREPLGNRGIKINLLPVLFYKKYVLQNGIEILSKRIPPSEPVRYWRPSESTSYRSSQEQEIIVGSDPHDKSRRDPTYGIRTRTPEEPSSHLPRVGEYLVIETIGSPSPYSYLSPIVSISIVRESEVASLLKQNVHKRT